MGSINRNKPHAVLLPLPIQGHINPFMQLAKLLHSKGFHITFVNNEFNHDRLIRSRGMDFVKGLTDFQFGYMPDGLPPSNPDATQDIPVLCDAVRKNCLLRPFRELVANLNSSPDVSTVTCIISDGGMSFANKVAEELSIPKLQFWPFSAAAYMGCAQIHELIKRGIIPFKDENFMTDGTLDAVVDWVPGMKNMRLRDFPALIRVTDLNDQLLNFIVHECSSNLHADAIILNTFAALEQEVLDALKEIYPNIYTIGPFPFLLKHAPESQVKSFRTNLWREDFKCLAWLDKQKNNSVVYVNYGSITVLTDQQLKEFAWGLANSKHTFLWVLRPDIVEGSSEILSQEYYKEIEDRGMVTTWCPQDKVLSHPSIACFLTHCGWNSILESISAGVPVLCWPFFADQQTNCWYSCNELGIGLELSNVVACEELVKDMMEGDKGKQMRIKALHWKKMAEKAADVGGSSYNNFQRFIKEVLHYDY